MNRIEISPLFKFSQEHNLKYINPLIRIFKATDTKVTEHDFIPLDPNSANINRYERHEVDKKNFKPESQIAFFITPVPIYQKLSPQLHRFDYAY